MGAALRTWLLAGSTPSEASMLYLNALVLLVCESSRGLFVSSLYPFLLALSHGRKEEAQRLNAFCVVVYSVGRLFAAPLWGYLADRMPFRNVYMIALLVAASGHVLYLCAEAGGGSVSMAIVARAMVGLGSGILGVTRAVVSVLTPPERRTGWYSLLSVAKFAGYALTPILAIAFGDPPADTSSGIAAGPHWDCFTRPAAVLAAASCAMIVLALSLMDTDLRGTSQPRSEPGRSGKASQATPLLTQAPSTDCTPLLAPVSSSPSTASPELELIDLACSAPARGKPLRPLSELALGSPALAATPQSERPRGGEAGPGAVAFAPTPGPRSGGLCGAVDPAVAVGVALFVLLNGVSKGVLTLIEAVATPLFIHLEAPLDNNTQTSDVAMWFAALGSAGFLVYGFMALPRKGNSWLPSDLSLLLFSCLATGCGALVLAHPWAAPFNLTSLSAGAMLVWSVGAPIADVVATSCFSMVIAGKAQGKWMGFITMAGSLGEDGVGGEGWGGSALPSSGGVSRITLASPTPNLSPPRPWQAASRCLLSASPAHKSRRSSSLLY